MKLSEELSTLRNNIKKVSPDTNINDSLLYSSWIRKRAAVLRDQISRKNFINRSNYKSYCLTLEQVNSHNCTCPTILAIIGDLGCKVLQTKVDVPQTITGLLSEEIQITTLGGKPIGITEESLIPSEQSDPIKSKAYRATWSNQRLFLWNVPSLLVGVKVRGLWADPVKWSEIQHCDDSNPCVDVLEEETGLSIELSDKVIMLATQLYLETTGRLRNDNSQNMNEEV